MLGIPHPTHVLDFERCAQQISTRTAHPALSLANLRDPDKMPFNLRAAHDALDAAGGNLRSQCVTSPRKSR